MGRRKIEIKAIKEERNRSVTFLKRKGGLFKKAHELSVLCSVDIAVIIFGSNKKLYEYSSGDMSDILGRYTYYETPHEHKGPADFQGKTSTVDDDDDDVDMASPPPETHDHMHHPHMHHPGLPHMDTRQGTASASPPINSRNLGGYPQRNSTPQPVISRPSSRNAPRRVSGSNLNPQQGQNGFAYMPGPPVYNPGNQHQPLSQNINQGYQYTPNPPQPTQNQSYLPADDRRQSTSMPPAFGPPASRGPTDNTPPIQQNEIQAPPMIEKRPAPFKSRSIFTPIVGPDSELGKFMFPSSSDNDSRSHMGENSNPSRANIHRKSTPPPIKSEEPRDSPKRSPPRSAPLQQALAPIEPSQSIAPPPTRSNSLPSAPAKRPTLTLTIPSEQGDGNDVITGDSSPVTAGPNQQPPTTRPPEAPHGSVVLPPPSPSVTLLSAGATGPANPFAPRPATTSGPPDQTPLSALPSRFLTGEMLPSPSTFFPEWSTAFGGRGAGGSSDMLPSPLNFQTPIAGQPQHNIFKEDLEASSKRKSPSLDSPDTSTATKKLKV
ncbi:hypothetical protein BDZ91DRAFT_792358 [Kalaharituber pfeilii]|nr:hypothetical protein BDZ91DRAFT_792358 [Kalaharituber pfeilii]